MAVYRQENCHLIAISAMTEGQVETILHGDLFAGDEKRIAPAELERLTRVQFHAFRQRALAAAEVTDDGARLPIFPVVTFPNVPQALLDEIVSDGAITDSQFGAARQFAPTLCSAASNPLPRMAFTSEDRMKAWPVSARVK
jgi:hypothetical protein